MTTTHDQQLHVVETTAGLSAAQTIVSEAMGYQYGVNTGGRLGTEIATYGHATAHKMATALESRGFEALVNCHR